MNQSVLVSAVRTPIGSFMGSLSSLKATELGAIAIKEAVKRANIEVENISEVIMGCALPAGVGQAPARQASIFAGLPNTVPCMTINKVCGSGLKSIMLADQAIKCGDAEIIVAGGFESMSNAPYYLMKARSGYRMGNGELIDGLIFDGLWDVYNDYHMGSAAELCAQEMNITREDQDAFAEQSYRRTLTSIEQGHFKDEIVPVEIKTKKGNIIVTDDEDPKKVDFEKAKSLRTPFKKDGTVTAFNAPGINDGAAAVVLMSEEKAKQLGLSPLARIISQVSYAHEPEWFTTAPVYAIEKVLKKANLTADDIDLFESNEAFSVQSLAVMQLAKLDPSKVNIRGGAVAMGHPIGASGARILTTLLYAMHSKNAKRGLAAICIGGGEASAIIIERE